MNFESLALTAAAIVGINVVAFSLLWSALRFAEWIHDRKHTCFADGDYCGECGADEAERELVLTRMHGPVMASCDACEFRTRDLDEALTLWDWSPSCPRCFASITFSEDVRYVTASHG